MIKKTFKFMQENSTSDKVSRLRFISSLPRKNWSFLEISFTESPFATGQKTLALTFLRFVR